MQENVLNINNHSSFNKLDWDKCGVVFFHNGPLCPDGSFCTELLYESDGGRDILPRNACWCRQIAFISSLVYLYTFLAPNPR